MPDRELIEWMCYAALGLGALVVHGVLTALR